MEFPVEATVHLNLFVDERRAQDVLRSHGLRLTDLGGRRLRVHGSFSQLRAAKPRLELLLRGAVSGSRDDRGWSLPGERRASPSRSSFRTPSRLGRDAIVVDSDVFRYADRFRKREMEDILNGHAVSMSVQDGGDSSSVTLRGRNSGAAAHQLQSLLALLGASLRTQEVPRAAMDRDGDALLRRIRQSGNVHDSVLVRETQDGLHLVGPSSESFQLQQQLMGDSAGRGRGQDRGSRLRSSSSPAVLHGNRGRTAADHSPPPGGAAGYSPPGNPDGRTEPKPKASWWRRLSFRGRSRRDPPQERKTERARDASLDRRDTMQNPTSSNRLLDLFRRKKRRK